MSIILVLIVLGIWIGHSPSKMDHNGVRDDVEKFINEKYADEKIRLASKEWHRSLQQAIRSKD